MSVRFCGNSKTKKKIDLNVLFLSFFAKFFWFDFYLSLSLLQTTTIEEKEEPRCKAAALPAPPARSRNGGNVKPPPPTR